METEHETSNSLNSQVREQVCNELTARHAEKEHPWKKMILPEVNNHCLLYERFDLCRMDINLVSDVLLMVEDS